MDGLSDEGLPDILINVGVYALKDYLEIDELPRYYLGCQSGVRFWMCQRFIKDVSKAWHHRKRIYHRAYFLSKRTWWLMGLVKQRS